MPLLTERGAATISISPILEAGTRSGALQGELNLSYAEMFWNQIINPYANPFFSPLPYQETEEVIMPAVDIYLYGIAQRNLR